MAAKKESAKKSTAKKTAAKKASGKKAPAKKTAAKKTAAKKTAAKKTGAKKTAAKKAPAKKTAAKKTGPKKAGAKKVAAKKAPAKKTAAKKAPAEKRSAKKSPARKTATTNNVRSKQTVTTSPTTIKSSEVFSARFLETQRASLVDERAKSVRQSRSLRDEAESLVEDFQSGDVQFDEESGEGDTLNVAREQDLMMSSQADSKIEEIDHALAKFELDTYGICEVSGEPIPEVRLEAIPWARERVEFKAGGLTRR